MSHQLHWSDTADGIPDKYPGIIPLESLPQEAQRLISEMEEHYTDEFTFYWFADDDIEAWFAGDIMAIWNGKGWV